MADHGKKYLEAAKKVDRQKLYEPEQAVTKRGAALDEAVLRQACPQLGGDQLARPRLPRDHAQIAEKQRAVLQCQAGTQLLLVDQ